MRRDAGMQARSGKKATTYGDFGFPASTETLHLGHLLVGRLIGHIGRLLMLLLRRLVLLGISLGVLG